MTPNRTRPARRCWERVRVSVHVIATSIIPPELRGTCPGAFHTGGSFGHLPGRFPFDLTWSYNSQDNSDGPLGKGTSLSIDYFITPSAVLGAGYFELVEPGNLHFAFHNSGSGTYVNS